MTAADLRSVAALLRERADAATDVPGERWMVDMSPDYGLVLGSHGPGDVHEDGSISTGCAAYFAYPDDEAHATHKNALAVATLAAGMDPPAQRALADLLDALVPFAELAAWTTSSSVGKAAQVFVDTYQRKDSANAG